MTARSLGSTASLPPREYLTLADAAAWTGLSSSTIRRAKRAGRLAAKKTADRGGKELYRVADLRSFLESLEDA